MSDLDSDGNVDYSNIPAFTVRGKQTNTTDIRRRVSPDSPTIFQVAVRTLNTADKFSTIKELTGISTCVEGVEILRHGNTLDSIQQYRGFNTLIKLGGETGDATYPVTADFLKDVFVVERTKFAGGFGPDPLLEKSESIFIPCNDLSKVALAGITNSNSVILANFPGKLEVHIK